MLNSKSINVKQAVLLITWSITCGATTLVIALVGSADYLGYGRKHPSLQEHICWGLLARGNDAQ